MKKPITPKIQINKDEFNQKSHFDWIEKSLICKQNIETQTIRFSFKNFEGKDRYFELDSISITSRPDLLGDWCKVDLLNISAMHESYIKLAILMIYSTFTFKTINIQLKNSYSFIKNIIIRPIEFSDLKLKIKHWDFSYNTLDNYLNYLDQSGKKLEFLQTSDLNHIPKDFEWQKDRNKLLIQGDIFQLLSTAELLLNFAHPYTLYHPYNGLENELELTGHVGYVSRLSSKSANVNFWLPDSIGYDLNISN